MDNYGKNALIDLIFPRKDIQTDERRKILAKFTF